MKAVSFITGGLAAVGAALYGWSSFDGQRKGTVTAPGLGYVTAATLAGAAFLLIRQAIRGK